MPVQAQREAKWVWVYGLLVAVITCIAFGRALLFFHFTFKASSAMHDSVVQVSLLTSCCHLMSLLLPC